MLVNQSLYEHQFLTINWNLPQETIKVFHRLVYVNLNHIDRNTQICNGKLFQRNLL